MTGTATAAHAHRADALGESSGGVVVGVHPGRAAGAVHHRREGVALDRCSSAHRPLHRRVRNVNPAEQRNFARVVSPQPGSHRTNASAHFVGHRVEDLRRFDPAGHQRGHSPQGRLLGGEATVLGVHEVNGHGELLGRDFGGVEEFVHDCITFLLFDRRVHAALR